jgi:hypothetical protein
VPAEPNSAVSPKSLTRERLQLHYAARLLASVAHSLLDHAEDDSHSNLGLDKRGSTLTTNWLDESGRAVSLDLGRLAISWSLRGAERVRLELPGKTMAEAYQWLNESKPNSAQTISERDFPDFPAHLLGDGGKFVPGDPGRRVQLGRYFTLGQRALESLTEQHPMASAIRVWPHHFDLGMMIPIDLVNKSVGLGLSPGDSSYDEPYFYVSRYPTPDATSLPHWEGAGHWHTEEFVSLVLTASEWQLAPGDQEEVVTRFVSDAMALVPGLEG